MTGGGVMTAVNRNFDSRRINRNEGTGLIEDLWIVVHLRNGIVIPSLPAGLANLASMHTLTPGQLIVFPLLVLEKSRSTRRALVVILIVYTTEICQGLAVMQVYAKPLFEEAIPNMSATLSSALLAVISVVAICVAAYLVDMVGRRALIIYSSIGAGVSCVILGIQIMTHWGPYWINGVFIYLFTITHTCGSATVPIVLVSEVFLPEIKSVMSMISVEWAWICNFMILFIFNPLVSAIGLGPVFLIFAGICFGTAVFCYFFLPETKGLSVNVIQTLFAKKN